MQMLQVLRTPQTLEKPWFPIVSNWIEWEGVTGAGVAEKAPKAGPCQLIKT
jgi:hypothetical protein